MDISEDAFIRNLPSCVSDDSSISQVEYFYADSSSDVLPIATGTEVVVLN